MRVPLSWLNEYVDIKDIAPDQLAERLTTAGLEVDQIDYIGVPGPAGAEHLVWDEATIKVGEIVAVEPHPNADRLRLVTVNYGADAPKTVVTGAPNVRVGQRVGYAMTGATVLNGHSEAHERITLEPKKLRGIMSEGMVLSEQELGLSGAHEGIMDLPADAPIGTSLQSYMGDVVLDISLTPNLGRAASIVGVAREMVALFNRPLRYQEETRDGTGAPISDAVRIEIEVPDLNPRFTATLIRNVTIGPSPAWMQRRLTLAGQRPINNIVDVTNYVMLEVGQPLHAFDYDVLVERARRSGQEIPTITMRVAEEGESLQTLDKKEHHLHPQDVLVTDSAGILSLAGMMGGLESGITDTTTTILLEAAAWDFISIRRSSHRHLLFSEAAYRFGRGVHPAMASRGNWRAAHLMAEVGGGEVAQGIVDEYPTPAPAITLPLTAREVNRLLGTTLALADIASYLERLQFKVERDGDTLHVTAPDTRLDIGISADLVEEVARVYGLDRLPATLMDEALPPLRDTRAIALEERIKDILLGLGLAETVSYMMTSPDAERLLVVNSDVAPTEFVTLTNPISPERSVLRRTMLVSLLENLTNNLRHRAAVRLFEIGLVYTPRYGDLPTEERRVAAVLSGPTTAATWQGAQSGESDYYAGKGLVEELANHLHLTGRISYEKAIHPSLQPGRTATVTLDREPIGVIGELHPLIRRAHDLPETRIAVVDLSLNALIEAAPPTWRIVPVPRYPGVLQDIAVVVPQTTPAQDVEALIRQAGGNALASVALFDVYQGNPIPEGMKSLAYALEYVHPDKTYTDTEVAQYHSRIANALRQQLGAKIRGEDL